MFWNVKICIWKNFQLFSTFSFKIIRFRPFWIYWYPYRIKWFKKKTYFSRVFTKTVFGKRGGGVWKLRTWLQLCNMTPSLTRITQNNKNKKLFELDGMFTARSICIISKQLFGLVLTVFYRVFHWNSSLRNCLRISWSISALLQR